MLYISLHSADLIQALDSFKFVIHLLSLCFWFWLQTPRETFNLLQLFLSFASCTQEMCLLCCGIHSLKCRTRPWMRATGWRKKWKCVVYSFLFFFYSSQWPVLISCLSDLLCASGFVHFKVLIVGRFATLIETFTSWSDSSLSLGVWSLHLATCNRQWTAKDAIYKLVWSSYKKLSTCVAFGAPFGQSFFFNLFRP